MTALVANGLAFNHDVGSFTKFEKIALILALAFYVSTALVCLFELRVDARRFFDVAKQLDRPAHEQDWGFNAPAKKLRLQLMYSPYITAACATLAVLGFLVSRIG